MGEQQRLIDVPASSAEKAAEAKSASGVVPSGAPGKVFRDYQPGQTMLLPPSLDEWLPAEHLARFVDELVEQHLDLGPFYAAHPTSRGSRHGIRG